MIDIAAITAVVLLAGLTVFQLALISGAPLGKYAWGGAHTVLPVNLRIGSMVSILLYGLIAAIILSKAEIFTLIDNKEIVDVGAWVIAIYFATGILLNGISKSKRERNLMTPIVLVLTVATTLVALS